MTVIEVPLRNLTLHNAGNSYDLYVVGTTATALETEDGDTSYVGVPIRNISSDAISWVEGTFDAVPGATAATDVSMRMVHRIIGGLYAYGNSGAFTGSFDPDTAANMPYYSESTPGYDEETYSLTAPDPYGNRPRLSASDLAALEAGTLKGAVWNEWGTTDAGYVLVVTYVALIVNTDPPPPPSGAMKMYDGTTWHMVGCCNTGAGSGTYATTPYVLGDAENGLGWDTANGYYAPYFSAAALDHGTPVIWQGSAVHNPDRGILTNTNVYLGWGEVTDTGPTPDEVLPAKLIPEAGTAGQLITISAGAYIYTRDPISNPVSESFNVSLHLAFGSATYDFFVTLPGNTSGYDTAIGSVSVNPADRATVSQALNDGTGTGTIHCEVASANEVLLLGLFITFDYGAGVTTGIIKLWDGTYWWRDACCDTVSQPRHPLRMWTGSEWKHGVCMILDYGQWIDPGPATSDYYLPETWYWVEARGKNHVDNPGLSFFDRATAALLNPESVLIEAITNGTGVKSPSLVQGEDYFTDVPAAAEVVFYVLNVSTRFSLAPVAPGFVPPGYHVEYEHPAGTLDFVTFPAAIFSENGANATSPGGGRLVQLATSSYELSGGTPVTRWHTPGEVIGGALIASVGDPGPGGFLVSMFNTTVNADANDHMVFVVAMEQIATGTGWDPGDNTHLVEVGVGAPSLSYLDAMKLVGHYTPPRYRIVRN